ncbi:hypothetical protein HP568_12065 [Brevibacillus sp. MS2.2]|nr:hypothetical protein [Brevibacillus sp. MS2.2]
MITWALGHLVTLADLKRRSAIQLVANRGFADFAVPITLGRDLCWIWE